MSNLPYNNNYYQGYNQNPAPPGLEPNPPPPQNIQAPYYSYAPPMINSYSSAYNQYPPPTIPLQPSSTHQSAIDAAIQRIKVTNPSSVPLYNSNAWAKPPVIPPNVSNYQPAPVPNYQPPVARVTQPAAAETSSNLFPPALVNYCDRVFASCSTTSKPPTQKYLQDMIKCAVLNKLLWKINWEVEPMPRSVYDPNIKFDEQALLKKFAPPAPAPVVEIKNKEDSNIRKRPNGFGKADYEDDEPQPKLSKKQEKKRMNDQLNDYNGKDNNKLSAKEQAARAKANKEMANNMKESINDYDESKRNSRSTRFQVIEKPKIYENVSIQKPKVYKSTDTSGELDWDSLKIIGTCTELEKKFLRLTSAPNPDTVRPEHILRKAYNKMHKAWLANKGTANHNYLHLWEQFKALRQDLMVQSIRNNLTVEVYETHARICLEEGDLSEFNQCQTQLIQLYDNEEFRTNYTEFTAYRFLYYMVSNDSWEAHNVLKECRKYNLLGNSNIQFAMNIWNFFTSFNYTSFFRALNNPPLPLLGNVINNLVAKFRFRCLVRICEGFKTFLEINLVSEWLGFTILEGSQYLLNSGCVFIDDKIDFKSSKIIEYVETKTDDSVHVTHGAFDSRKKK